MQFECAGYFYSMKSMTGYGRATADYNDYSISVDVSSVNKKGLEIYVSILRDWLPMERLINSELKKLFARGKFNISVSVEFKREAEDLFASEESIAGAMNALKKLCLNNGVVYTPETSTILEVNKMICESSSQSKIDWQCAWEFVQPVIISACENLDKMREVEGEQLKIDLQQRIQTIQILVDKADSIAKTTPQSYKETLLQRIANLGLEIDCNDERLLKEVCIFADKCDVSEEITRLGSHTKQFLQILNSTEAVGRKLDFLCQEIGREINTTASKANNIELTKITLYLKNELERVREQVQNLE